MNFFTETVVGAGERQALGNDTGGEDDGISQDGLRIGEDFEVSGGKIDLGDSFNEDLSVEVEQRSKNRPSPVRLGRVVSASKWTATSPIPDT